MPSSWSRSFSDVEEYRAAIRPSNTEFLLTAKSQPFWAAATRIDLLDLGMQRLTETVARAWQVAITTPRIGFIFSAQPGSAGTHGGVELANNEIGLIARGIDVWHRISGPIRLASLSLPEDAVARHSEALFGRDLTPRRDHFSTGVPIAMLTRLRRLHAAVARLAETSPEIIASTDATRGLEASLTEASLNCLAAGRLRESRVAQRNHAAIVRRLSELARQRPEQPLYLLDVCSVLGVGQRILHLSCCDQLGIGPKQYLVLRRLHLAHKALRSASSVAASVTEIATRFGFWELGRFAATYRSIFGETPSATLHRQGN